MQLPLLVLLGHLLLRCDCYLGCACLPPACEEGLREAADCLVVRVGDLHEEL